MDPGLLGADLGVFFVCVVSQRRSTRVLRLISGENRAKKNMEFFVFCDFRALGWGDHCFPSGFLAYHTNMSYACIYIYIFFTPLV